MTPETSWSAEEVLPILRRVSLFEGLPEEDLRRVAGIVRGGMVGAGEVVFEEGDPGDAFYVVFDGGVEIVKAGADGEEEKLAFRRPGEGFGEMALLDDAPRSATARAAGPTRLIVVDREDFRELLGGDTIAIRMMQALSRALRALDIRFTARRRRADQAALQEVARTLQRAILPRNAPKVEGYEIAAGTTLEYHGEGRTVWDTFLLRDGPTALVSLHVRGRDLPPSHYLGLARTLMRQAARDGEELEAVLRRTDEALADGAIEGADHFVDAGVLVLADEGAVWTGAGRPAGAVVRRDGELEELPSHGPPLGMMGGFRYGSHPISLALGDAVLVLSQASKGLLRGATDLVAGLRGKPVGEVVSTVHKALRKAHPAGTPETTVLFVRRTRGNRDT